MKYLKLFEENSEKFTFVECKESWSPFTKWAYDNYINKLGGEIESIVRKENLIMSGVNSDIVKFFDDLESEYLDTDDWGIYEVFDDSNDDYDLFGVYTAHGKLHAVLKMAIDKKDPMRVIEDYNCTIIKISEDDVEKTIKDLSLKLKIYKSIK